VCVCGVCGVCIYVCVCMSVSVYARACMYVRMFYVCICIYVCMCVCVCVCVCVNCVCVCVCVCVCAVYDIPTLSLNGSDSMLRGYHLHTSVRHFDEFVGCQRMFTSSTACVLLLCLWMMTLWWADIRGTSCDCVGCRFRCDRLCVVGMELAGLSNGGRF